MIALYLLAAHMVGDFVLQTRWQAERKLGDACVRTVHVLVYSVPFVPIAFYVAPSWRAAVSFLAGLYVLHFLTDSRRVRSTLGDWIAWQLTGPEGRADELERVELRKLTVGEYHSAPALLRFRPSPERAARAAVPPNPWTPVPILVDQTLHLCQIALLGGLLLTGTVGT